MTNGACKLGVEQMLFARVHFYGNRTLLCQAQGRFKTFGNSLTQRIARRRFGFMSNFETVHHQIDVVLFGFLEGGQVFDFDSFAVDSKAHIAQCLHLFKNFFKLTFAFACNGRHDHEACVFGQL